MDQFPTAMNDLARYGNEASGEERTGISYPRLIYWKNMAFEDAAKSKSVFVSVEVVADEPDLVTTHAN